MRLVDVVDHRGERGRLAAAGRAGDQHEALLLLAQTPRAPAAGRGPRAAGSCVGIEPEHGALAAVLHERVDAEAQRCRRARTRSRPRACSWNVRRCASFITSKISRCVSSGDSAGTSMRTRSPWMRSIGGSPAEDRWRSERPARPRSAAVARSSAPSQLPRRTNVRLGDQCTVSSPCSAKLGECSFSTSVTRARPSTGT